jgi:hypothetical protein
MFQPRIARINTDTVSHMIFPLLPLASGDPALYALLAGVLLLAGTAIGLAIAGMVLVFGKGEDRRRLGKRLLLAGLVPIIVGVVWWIAFVGFD